jgi:hypothetical protein
MLLFSAVFFLSSFSLADHLNIGGFQQMHPGEMPESQIGAGWGHRSMTFGMMNLMSGMTTQVAKIIRSGKASPLMMKRLAEILDHIAEMMNYAPAYMMGTKVVDSEMMNEMQNMLKDIEKMRKELGL